jgi:hypothetical protein
MAAPYSRGVTGGAAISKRDRQKNDFARLRQTGPFISPNSFLLAKPMMHFRSGRLMQFCSGIDTGPKKTHRDSL